MSAVIGRDPVDGYVWLYAPSIVVSSGPERVVRDEPDPDYRPRPVGFAPPGRHRRPGPAVDSPGCSECGAALVDDPRADHGMCAGCLHDALRSGWVPR